MKALIYKHDAQLLTFIKYVNKKFRLYMLDYNNTVAELSTFIHEIESTMVLIAQVQAQFWVNIDCLMVSLQ